MAAAGVAAEIEALALDEDLSFRATAGTAGSRRRPSAFDPPRFRRGGPFENRDRILLVFTLVGTKATEVAERAFLAKVDLAVFAAVMGGLLARETLPMVRGFVSAVRLIGNVLTLFFFKADFKGSVFAVRATALDAAEE